MRSRAVMLAVALVACHASAQPGGVVPLGGATCEAGARALDRDVLYLGRNRPDGGVVSDDEWARFVTEVVLPRFPQGFTVQEAAGHWRADDGATVRERTMVLTILRPRDAASAALVGEIAAQYGRWFRQEAVLREHAPVCGALQRTAD